jgi:hypothetical protein
MVAGDMDKRDFYLVVNTGTDKDPRLNMTTAEPGPLQTERNVVSLLSYFSLYGTSDLTQGW